MRFVIGEEWEGQPLKKYLSGGLRLSRAQTVELKKEENGILLDGAPVYVSAILHAGQTLELALEDRESAQGIVPTEMPLEILFEDEYLVAAAKPPFMPTHPSLNHYADTLANALAYHYKSENRPFVFRAVNRLDRDTSGIVLAAKDKHTSFLMSKMIARRLVDKRYAALLDGILEDDHGFIEKNVVRASDSIMLRRTDETLGAYALTEYSVLGRSCGHTLASAIPHTGRTHQLRVHFSSIGHPVTGDTMYGEASAFIGRQALHAYLLIFDHPVSGERTVIRAPLPDDFKSLLKEYGFEKVVL